MLLGRGEKGRLLCTPRPLAVGTLHTEPGTLSAGHYLYKQVKQGLFTLPGAMWPALSVNIYRMCSQWYRGAANSGILGLQTANSS